jgi:outer membrane protein assembly factor BamB
VRGVRINTDWTSSPPVEMWRRQIGPGWSSFAVSGDLLYTQEQRGDDEIVSCYRVSTGEPVWRHRDATRFWEANGGPGPRATPTVHNGRVYAFGATGILNALDARTGKPLWSRNVAADTSRQVPYWGFASSPLVVDDVVVVAAAGTLAAYDPATGNPRWQGPRYGGSYSSPHLAVLDGVEQIVLLGGPGAISVAPADGALLWEHKWDPGPIVQPALTGDGDILVNSITATGGVGTRRLSVKKAASGWNVEERWTSTGLKPYFNDFVVHEGYAYGFDNNIMAAIDLADGQRKWKGGRYGNGQLVLLADQDVLLVSSEDGELALVSATPARPGITRCSWAMCCWCVTASRWRRSGLASRERRPRTSDRAIARCALLDRLRDHAKRQNEPVAHGSAVLGGRRELPSLDRGESRCQQDVLPHVLRPRDGAH